MPDNPGESLLEPGFSYKVFGWPFGGFVMIGIGGFIAWLALSCARNKESNKENHGEF